MNKYPIKVGSVVISKMGHDEGRSYITCEEVDEDFVLVVNGKHRGMENPKKKRRKHLKTTGLFIQEVADRIAAGLPIENHELRSWLKKGESEACQNPM